jgi:hypothetical protein
MTPEKQLLFASQLTLDVLVRQFGKQPARENPELASAMMSLNQALKAMQAKENPELTDDTLSKDASDRQTFKELFDPVFGKN